jgi:uncharacterized membrane protein YqiK
MHTIETVTSAYDNLTAATIGYHNAAKNEASLDTEIKRAVAEATANGTIAGKNQQLRDAEARELYADRFRALDAASEETARRRLHLDLARIEIERVRMIQRIMELGSTQGGAT